MFDLCGFDRFDMIGAVLENREALVKSLKQNKIEMRAELSRWNRAKEKFYLN